MPSGPDLAQNRNGSNHPVVVAVAFLAAIAGILTYVDHLRERHAPQPAHVPPAITPRSQDSAPATPAASQTSPPAPMTDAPDLQTAALPKPVVRSGGVRIQGNLTPAEADQLKGLVVAKVSDVVENWNEMNLEIHSTIRDAEPAIGGVPVASITASWTLTNTANRTHLGATKAIERFGTSSDVARSSAIDAASAEIAQGIINTFKR